LQRIADFTIAQLWLRQSSALRRNNTAPSLQLLGTFHTGSLSDVTEQRSHVARLKGSVTKPVHCEPTSTVEKMSSYE